MITVVGFESNYLNLKMKQVQIIDGLPQEKASEIAFIVCVQDRNLKGYRIPITRYDLEIKAFDLSFLFRLANDTSRVITMRQNDKTVVVGRGCIIAS
jgi:hypothetical protein